MLFIVIDRNNGCRPARNGDGTVKTVEAVDYEAALAEANGDHSTAGLSHPFEVMPRDYIQSIVRPDCFPKNFGKHVYKTHYKSYC